MNINSRCQTIYQFPPLNSLQEQLWGPSIVEPSRHSLADRIQHWMSSFDIQNCKLYERNAYAADKEHIKNAWSSGDILVHSILDHAKYMAIASALNRFLELVFLSLRTSISQSTKFTPRIKKILDLFLTIAPYAIIISFLGYPVSELIFCKIILYVLSRYAVPYKISNFFREMDLLSSNKDLHAKDFLVRNSLIFIRNYFFIRILLDLLYFHLFHFFIELDIYKASNYDVASIQICEVSQELAYVKLINNDLVERFRYWMMEFGWIAGKMLFDLVFILIAKKILHVNDLRDPLRPLMLRLIPDYEASPHVFTPSQKKNPKQNTKKYKKPKTHQSDPKPFYRQPQHKEARSGLLQTSPTYDPSKYVNVDREITKKGPKVKTKRAQETPTPETKEIKQQPLKASFKHWVADDMFKFVQLAGDNHNKNVPTWGVVIPSAVKRDHLDIYMGSLKNGYIREGSAVTKVGKSLYEIRPTRFDSRLFGLSYKGNDCYNALKSYMPFEDALAIMRKLENGGEIRLIIFALEVSDHKKAKKIIISHKKDKKKQRRVN